MKTRRLKRWVRITIGMIAIAILLLAMRSMQKAFVRTCVEQGYSMDYCIKNS